MTNDRKLHRQLESAARAMHGEADVQDTVDRAAALAPGIVDGCDHAGVTIITRDGEIQTQTASDEIHRQVEDLQHALREGPCRSEEHTSELQSRGHLVCRLLLEKK